MNEIRWVNSLIGSVSSALAKRDKRLGVQSGKRLAYAWEIRQYDNDDTPQNSAMDYETDLIVTEQIQDGGWIPRVVVEAKLGNISTHDAITYSQKSASHKQVHPYLRYGILIGDRKHYPLPGRLIRHGTHFDFMVSWKGTKPNKKEFRAFVDVLIDEVSASRLLEEIIFNSRSQKRERFTVLHKPLLLK